MKLGDCFTTAVPPKYDVPHFYIVITDPLKNPGGMYHIVNITSDQLRAGNECILNVGDHKWITKECFVTFGDTLEIAGTAINMISTLTGTKVILQDSAPAGTLEKIVAAAKLSKAIPKGYKAFL